MVLLGVRDAVGVARLLQQTAPFSLACLPNSACSRNKSDGQLASATWLAPRFSRLSRNRDAVPASPVASSLIETIDVEFSADKPRGGLPRFHVDTLPSSKGLVMRVEGDEFWHMTKVLRLKVDDRVELFDGKGGIVEGSLRSINHQGVDVAAVEQPRILSSTGPSWHVAAAFGSLKGGRGDWLLEKCTELGARIVTPLLTHRSSTVTSGRKDRWLRVVQAATKQCQRLHSLELKDPTDFHSFLPVVAKSELSLLAVAEAPPLAATLVERAPKGGLLLVGPEGDFTEEEISVLVAAGATPVGLGPRRLRVETAAVAMLSAVMLMSEQPLVPRPQ